MKKFAIAHADLFDNVNRISFHQAVDSLTALRNYVQDKNYEMENCISEEDIKEMFWNCDQLVAITEILE